MAELPNGTVTFLFTDIEGSTRLWERDAVAMRAAVARHDALLSAAIAAHQGTAYKHVGDAVQAAFSTATDAMAAAVEAQRALAADPWPETGPLRVRMALHAGEAAPDAHGDYHQVSALNRLARLLATGHGGQVLLTETVRRAIGGRLPEGVELIDLGKHRLRDLLEPEQVSQAGIDGLPAHFPPLKSLERHPTNLPVQPNALIGRDRDIADLHRLLTDATGRLVTLTGPGGIGKTRLALQAAAELLDHFVDGVFWVDLAPLADPRLVMPTIAATLGVREMGTLSLRDALVAYFADKQVLLVLDNYEHLLAAAPVTADLLAAAPHLRVLATSRAPLRLQAEREYPVPPLPLPTAGQEQSLDELSGVAAIALFTQRAQAVKPDFALSEDNAQTVAAICQRLDGLPLAIELAAARVKVLPPAALLARLERRLPLLAGGALDLPARQQTLRNTIAWSYDLLARGERKLFRRLAVFAGAATLEAVEAVANSESGLDVFAGVTGLIEQSLLRPAEGLESKPRFGMLETIREYALEQLTTSGEAEEMRQRHATWCVHFAERVAQMSRGGFFGNPQDVAELEAEYANLRAALTWLTEAGNAKEALRLAAALGGFWNLRGHMADGRSWLERTLANDDGTQPRVRARALTWLSVLVGTRNEPERGFKLLEEALALARVAGDVPGIAAATVILGWGELRGRGDAALATALGKESLALFEEAGVLWGITASRLLLAEAARHRGELDRATAFYEQLLADFRRSGGDEYVAAQTLHSLGTIAQAQGDDPQAVSFYAEALVRFSDLGDLGSVAWCLEGVAAVAGRQHPEHAARLLAAADTLRTAINVPLPLAERPEYDRAVAGVRATMGEPAFTAAWLAGTAPPRGRGDCRGARPRCVLAPAQTPRIPNSVDSTCDCLENGRI